MTSAPRVVLLMHPFAGYDRGLLEGIARYAQLHGPWVFCLAGEHREVPMPESDSTSNEMFPVAGIQRRSGRESFSLRRLEAAGVIGRIHTPAITRTLLSSGLPLIAIDLTKKQLADSHPLSKVSEVCADSHRAGRIAAEHLIDRGFTHFAFCGYEGRLWSDRRLDGFTERLREAEHSCRVYERPHRHRILPWDREQPSVTAWLRSLPKPVGVMTCNDIRGRQVIEACLEAGLRVPDDVAVVGVDEDRLLCELANPPMSSVVLNLDRAGYQAAELLDGLMAGRVRQPQRILVEALWVIPRRSTDVLAIEDRHLAAAVRFIRDHCRESITVSDVVSQSHISRRGLEIRFQQVLGRSIRQQIQQARLTWSKRLLVETNLSAEKIARACGFSSLSYMSSVFHRELGMTLTDYRRQSRNP
jgi:LacI family transcriptional regulator